MSFQNTNLRLKDKATPGASSTLFKADFLIKANAASGTVRAGEFTINATSGQSVNTVVQTVESLFAKTIVGTGNSTATTIATQYAGARVELNLSSGVPTESAAANVSYGLVVDVTNDANTRSVQPTAFIALGEKQGTIVGSADKANSVAYLLDLGYAVGASNTHYVNATATATGSGAFRNVQVSAANSATYVPGGVLAIRVNGVEKFIQLMQGA